MRGVVAGHDERGRLDPHDLLRLGSGRGIAVKESGAAGLDDPQISLQILRFEVFGERAVAGDAGRPGTGFRILPEAALFPGALDDSRQSLFARKSCVADKPRPAVDLPPVAADGPMEQQRPRGLWKARRERKRDGTTHASAHNEGGVDLQVIEQAPCLLSVEFPAQLFHPAAGLSGLAPVVNYDSKLRGELFERVG